MSNTIEAEAEVINPGNAPDIQPGLGLATVAPGALNGSPAQEERGGWIKMNPSDIEAAYAEKLKIGEINEEQLNLITSFLRVGKEQGINLTALAKEIGVTHTTIYRLFTAGYGAKLDSLLSKISSYLKLWQARAEMGNSEFVITSIVETTWKACDLARAHAIPVPLYGESQLGKSTALEEYQRRNNHGATIYVRMPAGGAYGKFVRRLAETMGETGKRNTYELSELLFTLLNPQKLLIVDEIHQCFPKSGNAPVRLQTIEYLRELYDETGCGMLICGTHIARDAMEKGKHAEILEQFRRRGVPPIQLPAVLPNEDMDKIASSFGLTPAPRHIMVNGKNLDLHKWRKDLVLSTGLKAYVTFLKMSGTIASKRKQGPSWEFVVSAHDILSKLSEQKEGK